MLVNLPNDIIAEALARKLMSLFVITDKNTGMKIMLCEMQADLSSNKINTRYYPITGNEAWLSIFTEEKDQAVRVSRDVVEKLRNNNCSNTDLMDYSKMVSQICMFTSVTMHSGKSFEAPDFNTMLKEIKVTREKKQYAELQQEDKKEPVEEKKEEGV